MSQTLESTSHNKTGEGTRTEWWLNGNFAPVKDEVEALNLKIKGALPPELTGVYMRNGPNPKNGVTPHWFLGNGMLHGVRLENGKAAWYRNRYVRTPRLEQSGTGIDPAAMMDRTQSSANTNIVRHAGKYLALEEAHFPYEVTRDLGTVGPVDFGRKLTTAFTAHPKFCPETGEMLAFGYGFMPPFLTYHRFDREGRLVQSTEIPVGGPTMIHDFCVTRRYAIFMDLPIVFDMNLAMKGTMPYRWSDQYPARIGVMPRDGQVADLKWFDVEPCYVFHPMNAYDEGDTIVFDVARYDRLWDKGWRDSRARLHRWTLDRKTGRAREETIDDRPVEFPRVADAKAGFTHRFGYAPTTPGEHEEDFELGSSLIKFDLKSGSSESHDFGSGRLSGEFVLASAKGAEDAGWLVGYVHNAGANKSSFVVLDATDMKAEPVAEIELPQRVPFGFHGNWFAD